MKALETNLTCSKGTMAAIYLLTCDKGLKYVGVSTDAKTRIRNHLSGNGSKLVKEALERGASFTHEILVESDNVNLLYLREAEFIANHNSQVPYGYNVDKGGHQGGTSSRVGQKNTQATLTEDQVISIREQFAAGALQSDLAINYNVCRENISAIVVGKSWKHVGGPLSTVRKPRPVTPEDIVLFKKGRAEGLTYLELGARFDRSPATIRKYCLL